MLIRELKETLQGSIQRMKNFHDQKRREEKFEIGDWAYLKLRPYRQQTLSQKSLYKLGARFYGPFQIIEQIGNVAYKLKLPDDAQIHPVVHVSQLKRRLGDGEVITEQLPILSPEGTMIIRPARAAEYRQVKRSGRFRWEVLIEWEGLPPEEATWENLAEMKNRFPEIILEDKDVVEEGRNDEMEARELKNAYNRARRAKIKETSQAQKGGPSS